jgi:hypothetical protein
VGRAGYHVAAQLRRDLLAARARFEAKHGRHGPVPARVSLGGCWLWTGATKKPSTRRGPGTSAKRAAGGLELPYGKFWFRGRSIPAHVFAFALETGRDPEKLGLISHECDNPLCVRASHLRESTSSKNQRDAYARGRKRVSVPTKKFEPAFCLGGSKGAHRFGVRSETLRAATVPDVSWSYGVGLDRSVAAPCTVDVPLCSAA